MTESERHFAVDSRSVAQGGMDRLGPRIDLLELLSRINAFLQNRRTNPRPVVLVVEDDEAFREYLELDLSDAGFDVFTARDGIEGVELARHVELDAVITDLFMPRMNGLGTLRELRCMSRTLPIFVVTGGLPDDLQADKSGVLEGLCSQNGISGFFRKPVDMDALVDALSRVTGRNNDAPAVVSHAAG